MMFELSPISKCDAEAATSLIYAALQDDPYSKVLHDVPASPATIASTLELALEDWDSDPTRRRMQVKDTNTGEMISGATWYIIPQRFGDDYKRLPDFKWPEGWHAEEATRSQIDHLAARNRIMGPKPYIFLETLFTSPTHQRRGAASLLMEWGIKQAHALNLPIFLSATPSGVPIYQKYKFQSLEDIPAAGLPNRVHACMILPAPFPEKPHNLIHSLLVPQPFPHLAVTTPSNSVHSSQSSSHEITIFPVTSPTDFSRLVEIDILAFATNRLISLMNPASYPLTTSTGAYNPSVQARAKEHVDFLAIEPGNCYLKAVDANGTIIGWTKWHFYDDLTREHYPFPPDLPPGSNKPLLQAAFIPGKEFREKEMKGKQYAYVAVLVIHPDWQRKGVGRKLLEVGLQVADQRGWECWIEASPAGLGLYKSLGWEVQKIYETDLGPFGGEEGFVDRTYSMWRRARVQCEGVGGT